MSTRRPFVRLGAILAALLTLWSPPAMGQQDSVLLVLSWHLTPDGFGPADSLRVSFFGALGGSSTATHVLPASATRDSLWTFADMGGATGLTRTYRGCVTPFRDGATHIVTCSPELVVSFTKPALRVVIDSFTVRRP